MGQFSELWMYCKETFELLKRRLFLFVPRLIFDGLLFAFIVLMVGAALIRGLSGVSILGLPVTVAIFTVVFIVASLIVESGQINLFAKAAMGHTVGMQDFWKGVQWALQCLFLLPFHY